MRSSLSETNSKKGRYLSGKWFLPDEEDIEDIVEQEEKELQDKTLARISEVKKLTAQLRSLHRDIARLRNEEKIKKKMAAVKNIKAATAEKIEP